MKAQHQYAFSFAFGSKGDGDGQFDTPMDVAVAPSGNIIVLDSGNARVQTFDPKGAFIRAFGGQHLLGLDEGDGKGKFFFPTGLAVSSSGDILIADTSNNRIQIMDEGGRFIGGFSTGAADHPHDVAAISGGSWGGCASQRDANLVVAYERTNRVQIFDRAGHLLNQFEGAASGDVGIHSLWSVAVTSSGNIVTSDYHAVQLCDHKGNVTRTLHDAEKHPGGPFATGVAAGPFGEIVAAFMGDPTSIKVLDGDGTVLGEFGHKGSGPGELNEPAGVAVDATGNVYVADKGNDRIQVFKASPT